MPPYTKHVCQSSIEFPIEKHFREFPTRVYTQSMIHLPECVTLNENSCIFITESIAITQNYDGWNVEQHKYTHTHKSTHALQQIQKMLHQIKYSPLNWIHELLRMHHRCWTTRISLPSDKSFQCMHAIFWEYETWEKKTVLTDKVVLSNSGWFEFLEN